MQPSDEIVETASLALYNRIRGRWGMRPVDSLEGNQSELVANLKGDVREVLAAVYSMIREEVLKDAADQLQRDWGVKLDTAAIREMAREA